MFKRILPFLLAAVLLTGCAAEAASAEIPADISTVPTATEVTAPPAEPLPPETEPADAAEQIVADMTLREEVGQLFIVRPDALDSTAYSVTALTDAMTAALADYPVGGIAMFSQNIESPEQITAFNEALQAASRIPLFIAVDEEGGLVARLANHRAFDLTKFKSAASISEEAAALTMGSTIGGYLKEYGFNMNFAPVADVNTNPDNPVIGTRSFSSDAETTALMAGAMADGLRQQEIIPVFKHFPGHGDTMEDSHNEVAVSSKTAEEMENCEWLPFLNAGSGDCVMVGHIAVPEITGDLTPATMSRQIVTGILKGQLGFEGLVITDSLEMGAITNNYTPGEAALGALEAGCDILLMPDSLQEAFDAVVAAVESGSFSEERLDETVKRILRFKQAHGLLFSPGVG